MLRMLSHFLFQWPNELMLLQHLLLFLIAVLVLYATIKEYKPVGFCIACCFECFVAFCCVVTVVLEGDCCGGC